MPNDTVGEEAPLRRPMAATLQERASRARIRVRIVALTTGTIAFVAARSLPPGTACTLTIRAAPPLDIELTIAATTSANRDLFACSAVVVRVRDRERARFDALVARRRVARSA
jgi:hypothetical protein